MLLVLFTLKYLVTYFSFILFIYLFFTHLFFNIYSFDCVMWDLSLQRTDLLVIVCRLSCSAVCGIFLDPGSNL